MSLSLPGLSAGEQVEADTGEPPHAVEALDDRLLDREEEEVPRLSGK